MLHTTPLSVLSSTATLSGAQGPDLTRYICVCALLLAAICGLAFGFRRLVGGALRTKAAQRSLQVVDMLPLGGKQKVCVVRCYDRTFALGVGEREINLIAELDSVHAQRGTDRKAFESELAEAAAHGATKPLEQQLSSAGRVQRILQGGGLFG